MIIILKPNTRQEEIQKLILKIESFGVEASVVTGTGDTIIGLVGDTHLLDAHKLEANKNVERVMHVQEPFKRANRRFKPENSVFNIGNSTIGGNQIALIAGPCSVESREQIISVAEDVKRAGAQCLRGGAFKPRTSPYKIGRAHV